MLSILFVIRLIFILSFLFSIYMLIRVLRVTKFLLEVNNLCHEYSVRHIGDCAYNWCWPKFKNFDSVFYSFKRLRLESFLTKDEIKRLYS